MIVCTSATLLCFVATKHLAWAKIILPVSWTLFFCWIWQYLYQYLQAKQHSNETQFVETETAVTAANPGRRLKPPVPYRCPSHVEIAERSNERGHGLFLHCHCWFVFWLTFMLCKELTFLYCRCSGDSSVHMCTEQFPNRSQATISGNVVLRTFPVPRLSSKCAQAHPERHGQCHHYTMRSHLWSSHIFRLQHTVANLLPESKVVEKSFSMKSACGDNWAGGISSCKPTQPWFMKIQSELELTRFAAILLQLEGEESSRIYFANRVNLLIKHPPHAKHVQDLPDTWVVIDWCPDDTSMMIQQK